MTLKSDVPVKDNLEIFALKKIDKEKLYTFLREMEFNRLLSQTISRYGELDKKFFPTTKQHLKIDVKNTINISLILISEGSEDK